MSKRGQVSEGIRQADKRKNEKSESTVAGRDFNNR